MPGPVAWPELETWVPLKRMIGEWRGKAHIYQREGNRCYCFDTGLEDMLKEGTTNEEEGYVEDDEMMSYEMVEMYRTIVDDPAMGWKSTCWCSRCR